MTKIHSDESMKPNIKLQHLSNQKHNKYILEGYFNKFENRTFFKNLFINISIFVIALRYRRVW